MPGSLAVSIDRQQWNLGNQTVPHSQSIIIPHNGLHSLAVPTISALTLQSSTTSDSGVVEPLRPAAVSPGRQQETALQISTAENNSSSFTGESNRNNCINGYIIWPRKMSPIAHKDNLLLNYLENSEKHAFKQSDITATYSKPL